LGTREKACGFVSHLSAVCASLSLFLRAGKDGEETQPLLRPLMIGYAFVLGIIITGDLVEWEQKERKPEGKHPLGIQV
jgi:hypothetical protein